MITVFLLDDHPVVVNGIAQYLLDINDVTVLGKAHSVSEATDWLRKNAVDVIVSDMNFNSEGSGIDLLLHIKEYYPRIKLIFYTMIEKSSYVREAVLAGVQGYVLKKYGEDEVYKAIKATQINANYYSPELVPILVQMPVVARGDEQPKALKSLTNRELEIMKLIAEDTPIGQIADELSIEESTIRTHRTNIMRKLNVTSNVGITHYAFKYKLINQELL